jgi:superfamily II DNA helicase RecQ
MRFHFTAVPVHGGAEAEQALNAFLGAHRVLTVERQLVADGAQSVWAICVAYTDATAPALSGPARIGPGRKNRVDYKEVLGELEFAVFARLREWRKREADRDGIPPYAVFTNDQLAEIVRRQVQTHAGLAEIDGIGPARVTKYGAAVLDLMRSAAAVAPAGAGG